MIDPGAVAERVAAVRGRIAAAGGGPGVELLAVTKGFGIDAITAAHHAGLDAVGENYAQELLDKVAALDQLGDRSAIPAWHFIGRLQRNKVRQIAPVVALWQTVDREQLAAEIARRAPGAAVLVQLNLSGEPQKGGCPPEEAEQLVARAVELGLDVRGLMGVAPAGEPEAARPGFRRLVALADRLGLAVRSIGMSADLEVAVQEGSTMVRVGRDLFGERPPRVVG
ncbi:MAG: YggS family pyridoxal phosphate-dependent enzyme [Acidimicrobiales bacterium]